MIIIPLLLMCSIGGFVLFLLTKFDPLFSVFNMEWVGAILMVIAPVGFILRLSMTKQTKYFETISPQEALIPYLRRDGSVIPVSGKRVYSGESFLDVPNLGLIEDLGKDCVFSWGGKKIRFGLENISYTPDPRYMNYTSELYRIGFNDAMDVYNVLNGLDVELMGRSYLKLIKYLEMRGSSRLLHELRDKKPTKNIRFKPGLSSVKKQPHRIVDTTIAPPPVTPSPSAETEVEPEDGGTKEFKSGISEIREWIDKRRQNKDGET